MGNQVGKCANPAKARKIVRRHQDKLRTAQELKKEIEYAAGAGLAVFTTKKALTNAINQLEEDLRTELSEDPHCGKYIITIDLYADISYAYDLPKATTEEVEEMRRLGQEWEKHGTWPFPQN